MSLPVDDPRNQLRSLKNAIFLALKNKTGFQTIQARLRRAYNAGLITNDIQQAVLLVCQPVRTNTMQFMADGEIQFLIEEIFAIEIDIWDEKLKEIGL